MSWFFLKILGRNRIFYKIMNRMKYLSILIIPFIVFISCQHIDGKKDARKQPPKAIKKVHVPEFNADSAYYFGLEILVGMWTKGLGLAVTHIVSEITCLGMLWKGHFRVNVLCNESRYTSLFILRRRSCLESFSLNIPGFCLLSFLVFFVGK